MALRGAFLHGSSPVATRPISLYWTVLFLLSEWLSAFGTAARPLALRRRLLMPWTKWNGPNCFPRGHASLPAGFLFTFPEFVPRSDVTWNASRSLVPHVFHRIYTNRNVTRPFCYYFMEAAFCDPTLDFTFVDFPAAEAFIRQHCGEDVAWAFKMLLPGAYRADLYRYCALYAVGGFSVDLGTVLKSPLSNFIPAHATFVAAEDPTLRNAGVLLGFMGAAPGHPVLRACMDAVVCHVRDCWYESPGETKVGALAITGPELAGAVIREYLRLAPGDAWPVGDATAPLVILPAAFAEAEVIQVFDATGSRVVVKTKFPGQRYEFGVMGYLTEASPHYSELYRRRQVYDPSACQQGADEVAKRGKLEAQQAELAREERLRGLAKMGAGAAQGAPGKDGLPGVVDKLGNRGGG